MRRRWRRTLRWAALALWSGLLLAFWLGVQRSELGPAAFATAVLERVLGTPWTFAAVLLLYLLRPLLLIPITVINLAAGFALGATAGVPLALVGTLLSASVGYAIGRFAGSAELADELAERWRFVRLLRERGFESVVAGGLMYLHADAVNVPAGLLRLRFANFLAGISLGNALTMTAAVLTGASLEGRLAGASISVEPWYLVAAAALFAVSFGVAGRLRRRFRPAE